MIVIDASIALAWTYDDERTDVVAAIFQRVARFGAIAPAIWPMEIANSFNVAVRKERITRPYRDELVANFIRLAIEVEHQPSTTYWYEILNLADRHNLTIYDASYLELAMRRQLPLATLDKELIAAALAEGVAVLP
ncbi:MAG TPA: type II toxin-antitoxin system VapC family toxin [Devosia sp.]